MDRNTPSQAEIRELVSQHIAERFARGASEADPLQALDQLHAQLVFATSDYEAGPQKQREAVCAAIIAVSEFLNGQGFSDATLAPLTRALSAIVNLSQQNHPDPLFCQKPAKTKRSRNLEDTVRQGHLAALVDAWLASASDNEGDEAAILDRAARHMSGPHFGALDRAALNSARTYQRKRGQHPLLYQSFQQMQDALSSEARAVGSGPGSLRKAVLAQINALNARADLKGP